MAKSKKKILRKRKPQKKKTVSVMKPTKIMRRNYSNRNQEKKEKGKNQPGFTWAVIPANMLWKKV